MLLARASPSSIILEDNEEKNAIEYALESNADISVVRILQHASIRERHRIQEQSSLKHDSFDDLRSSMTSLFYTNSSHSANNVIDADFL